MLLYWQSEKPKAQTQTGIIYYYHCIKRGYFTSIALFYAPFAYIAPVFTDTFYLVKKLNFSKCKLLVYLNKLACPVFHSTLYVKRIHKAYLFSNMTPSISRQCAKRVTKLYPFDCLTLVIIKKTPS